MTERLAGRRVLVVGAGTRPSDDPDAPVGNGRAIAVAAAREGASVAVADRAEDSARETAAMVETEGGKAVVVVGDVAEEQACETIIEDSAAQLGGLDGLVLNVGIAVGSRLAGTSLAQWDDVFAVNVRAHFLLSRASLPRMAEGGSIVFISSVAGLKPGSRSPAYRLFPQDQQFPHAVAARPADRHSRASARSDTDAGTELDRNPPARLCRMRPNLARRV